MGVKSNSKKQNIYKIYAMYCCVLKEHNILKIARNLKKEEYVLFVYLQLKDQSNHCTSPEIKFALFLFHQY